MGGTVRLTVSSVLGRKLVVPALAEFARQYPDIVVDCVLTDSHSDVIDERIDIGIRFGFLHDNRYVARELAKIHFYPVGTPELIDKVGMPASIAELDSYPLTALFDHKTGRYWPGHLPKAAASSRRNLALLPMILRLSSRLFWPVLDLGICRDF